MKDLSKLTFIQRDVVQSLAGSQISIDPPPENWNDVVNYYRQIGPHLDAKQAEEIREAILKSALELASTCGDTEISGTVANAMAHSFFEVVPSHEAITAMLAETARLGGESEYALNSFLNDNVFAYPPKTYVTAIENLPAAQSYWHSAIIKVLSIGIANDGWTKKFKESYPTLTKGLQL